MKLVIACSKDWLKIDDSIALENDLLFVGTPTELTYENLKEFSPDFVFFPHWSWLVTPEIFQNFECVVFHTAPLPHGRGGSPIQNLILEGFKTAPVCALKMTADLDAGPIYTKSIISLEGTLAQIFERIEISVNKMILEITRDTPTPVEQVGVAHNYKRLSVNDNHIPCGIDIEEIYDRIRMLDDEGYPQAFVIHGDIKIEFFSASLDKDTVVAQCKITKC